MPIQAVTMSQTWVEGVYIPLSLSFATFRAPESESVIRHLDVIRIRQAGTGGLRQPAKKFLYFLLMCRRSQGALQFEQCT
jgi:hypothetical protein